MVAYFSVGVYVVPFAAVFRDVTQRFPERFLSGEHCVTSRRTAAKETKVYATVFAISRRRRRHFMTNIVCISRDGDHKSEVNKSCEEIPHDTYTKRHAS